MPQYRTEVIIPDDRYVSLRLPDSFPEGRAWVIVWIPDIGQDEPPTVGESDRGQPPAHGHWTDPDREDVEWWDEFDGDRGGAPAP